MKFRLGDANDVPIPDAESKALAAACEVQVFFSAGGPEPELRRVQGWSESVRVPARHPKGVTGLHVITISVFDGAIVINTATSAPILKT